MPAPTNLPGWLAPLDGEVRRVADRLRSLSDVRLARPAEGASVSRAAAGHAVAQRLADLCQGVESRDAATVPAPRLLPVVGDFVVGDQVAVTGRDLLVALAAAGPGAPVWAGGRRVPATLVRDEATAALRALRLSL